MNFASKLLSAALLICVVTPSFSEVENRIIGGVNVDKEDWPSMTAILTAKDAATTAMFYRQFCGGNLINERWVLSAAHCFFEPASEPDEYLKVDASAVSVAIGIDYLPEKAVDDSIVEYSVKRIVTHAKYDPSNPASENDIALLELTTAAPNSVMDLFTSEVQSGTQATVIGWGATKYNPWTLASTSFPEQLKGVNLPVVSNSVCRGSYDDAIKSSHICAGEAQGGVDSCQGDSGGPLMIAENGVYKQAGIVSFGNGCGLADFYGVYTRASSFTGWISGYVVDGLASNSGGDSSSATGADDEKNVSGGLGANFLILLLLSLFGARRVVSKHVYKAKY